MSDTLTDAPHQPDAISGTVTSTPASAGAADDAAFALQVARRRHAWQALALGPLWQPRTGSLPGAGERMAVRLPVLPHEAEAQTEAQARAEVRAGAETDARGEADAPPTPAGAPHDSHPAWSEDHALADWDAVPWVDEGQDPAPADPQAPEPQASGSQLPDPLTPAQRWIQLREDVADCRRCRLAETRTHTVFGRGVPRQARWLLIGEAPGAEEDRRGEAFVGQAGKLLDAMLGSAGIDPDADVFIANVLKCRPPGNRNPERDEVAACEAFLHEQVRLVKPDCIILLGRFAAQSVLQSDLQIGRLRNKRHHITLDGREVPVVVTYHPAYLLRNQRDKLKAWEDLCLARSTVPAPAT